MFIQVIQGKVRDEHEIRRLLDRWTAELMPDAVGYLGTTAGIADDGTFVALARFESAQSAQQNSQRPEQGAWWNEMEKCFDGPVTFMDCDAVQPWLDGGSDDARFVQIMEGRSSDVHHMHESMKQHEEDIHRVRPEIIGGLMMEVGDDRFVDAIYFTSEDEARRGEQAELPDELRAEFEREMQTMQDVTYLDLHEPMLVSAKR
jgi:hypothetical protein